MHASMTDRRQSPRIRRVGCRVDRRWRQLYFHPPAWALVLAVAGCTASAGGMGAPDEQVESRLEAATAPARRAQVVFDWNMTDRDARFSGRGVLRLDSGQRARVDLFGPRGETLAAAIVENDLMRVVPQAAASMLPPPALLWSSLGVFRPPVDAPLTGTAAGDGGLTLEYTRDRTRWRFRFEGDRLRTVEWTDGSGRRSVELTGAADLGFPDQAVFRDWTEFRELTLRVTEVEESAAFEPDVWILPGER
jgi:hypothetical protein